MSGTPWNPDWATHKASDLAAAAGVKLNIKGLRHYTASQLFAARFDLRNTAARLGHGSGGATTLRHYADPVSEVDRTAPADKPGFPDSGHSQILVARWCGMGESLRPTVGVTNPDAGAVYPLGSSRGESARLQRQAEELAADSAALLDRVGLLPGQSAIDLGCGPRGILDMLAERVAPAGWVVGLDADPAHTAMAAEFAAAREISGVEIITGDARSTGLPAGSFDLVHARTLLVNLPEPAEAAAEMTRLARPGGWVASTEPDTEHALCYPPHPAFDRLRDIFTVAFRRNGADPWIGRRVAELFRQAGLEHVEAEARVQMYPHGNSRRTIRLDLVQSMRPQVLEMGLATATELDDLDAAARAHLDNPYTVLVSGLLFLTWGRKPNRAQQDLPHTS